MNSLYKLNAFTNIGIQQMQNDKNFVSAIHCKKVKITGKQKQIASNKVQKQIETLSDKIGCVGIAELALQKENKIKRFDKKKAFYNK